VPERAAVVDTQLRMPPLVRAINPKTDFFAPLRVDLHQVALGVYRYRLEAVVVETRSVGIESKVNFLSAARADLARATRRNARTQVFAQLGRRGRGKRPDQRRDQRRPSHYQE